MVVRESWGVYKKIKRALKNKKGDICNTFYNKYNFLKKMCCEVV